MELDLDKLSGALFKNSYKEEGSNQPDYKGSFQDKETKEKILEIAAWTSTSKDGNTTYFRLSLSEPYQKKQEKVIEADKSSIPDDDIPF